MRNEIEPWECMICGVYVVLMHDMWGCNRYKLKGESMKLWYKLGDNSLYIKDLIINAIWLLEQRDEWNDMEWWL